MFAHTDSSQNASRIIMLIWSRFGILVIVYGIGSFFLMRQSVNAVTNGNEYYDDHVWPKVSAALLSAALIWYTGQYVNRKGPIRELHDVTTGEKFAYQDGGGSTFFFVPMEYWALVCVVI